MNDVAGSWRFASIAYRGPATEKVSKYSFLPVASFRASRDR